MVHNLKSTKANFQGYTEEEVGENNLKYGLGVLASFVATVSGALVNVFVAKCRGCSNNILSISSSLTNAQQV